MKYSPDGFLDDQVNGMTKAVEVVKASILDGFLHVCGTVCGDVGHFPINFKTLDGIGNGSINGRLCVAANEI